MKTESIQRCEVDFILMQDLTILQSRWKAVCASNPPIRVEDGLHSFLIPATENGNDPKVYFHMALSAAFATLFSDEKTPSS